MTLPTWKDLLNDRLAPGLAEEIEIYETQIELRRQGKLDEKIFAETRLRRGVYGQRYDNGQRHDGVDTRSLAYPSGDAHQGARPRCGTRRGCSGSRSRSGSSTPTQLETLADLAEEYSDAIVHVTTRQDFQLHFVHLDDTPTLMRRLAAAGITTREACGNTVRNVTACPRAGVCTDETLRRHALRARSRLLPARPQGRAGLRPQVQDLVLGLRRERLRAGAHARHRLVAATAYGQRWHAQARLRDVRRRRPRLGALSGQAVLRVRRRGRAAAGGAGDLPRVRAPRREEATARARGSSSWWRSSGSTSSAGWSRRSARSSRPTSGGRAISIDLTSPTTHRRALAEAAAR